MSAPARQRAGSRDGGPNRARDAAATGGSPRPGRRRAALLSLGALLLPWAAAGCAGARRPPAIGGDERVSWHDATTGQPLGPAALLARLRGARWLLLGEVHDNPLHHRLRADLLRAILADGRPTRLVFEQIDRGHDAALAAAVAAFRRGDAEPAELARPVENGPARPGEPAPSARPAAPRGVAGDAGPAGVDADLAAGARAGGATEVPDAAVDAVVTAGQLDRRGWAWPLHRPVFAAALAGGAELAGGNLSRADAAQVVRSGSAGLPAELRRWFDPQRPEAGWTAAQQAAAVRAVDEGHCHALPASMLAPMALAQRARDAALADALLRPARVGEAAPARGVRTVLIAGNGHVQSDIGVPHYLRRAGEAASAIVSVGLLECAGPAAPASPDALAGTYDVVARTEAVPREDPCQGFAPPAPTSGAASAR